MPRSSGLILNRPSKHSCLGMDRSQSIDLTLEQTLSWFEELGYVVLLQSDIVSGRHQAVLQNCRYGILSDRFRQAIQRLNPELSQQQLESVLQQITASRPLPLLQQNRQWHLQLLNGVRVQSDNPHPATAKLIDFTQAGNNDWLVIRSFPVLEADYQHCLDLVVFVNGLPLVVLHGFQGGETAWLLRSAYLQLQTYQANLPRFFGLNELMILSNGMQARLGTISSSWKQFMPLHSDHEIHETEPLGTREPEMKRFIYTIFTQQRLLEIIQHFIVFRQERTNLTKKLRAQSFCTLSLPEPTPRKPRPTAASR
jgi:type I site-specific restriction-modification system R (restriction) subunit